ncbi:type I-E CRISPR-associated protein Cas7/Cse4/CasC [Nocardia brasiliensis]|uniref:Type I-E CRISPR-associated protein Cas7/Cse4/CasC n=1 Tax=Nocardia brasiliensis TaxID=37326 RepID=A0A6G9XXI8_NOCBR|nr:type I-E CRISPR-associated protein Cas7/Cse4/CasC [Nocardia brasiliensis]QIS05587.1 type I-E CRISPR-associated protein Cas7/Cse4/CasC [Nocardia brasiliensis]
MNRLFVDVHILQTVPPSNINRDDTGSPKTATYGGVRRARVSSQAWKRATRQEFRRLLDPATLGVRTKRIVELVADRIAKLDDALPEPEKLAAQALSAAGITVEKRAKGAPEDVEQSKYLLFLSSSQIDRLAALAAESATTGSPIPKAAAKKAATGANSIDVALFGRMVADASDLNIDAAAQVAHAISVHAVDNEFDYFTAVDDMAPADNAGAGMIGVVEFNSSTLYRYATVNVALLRENIGDDVVTKHSVATFLDAFVKSMPTGKQNTFANRTLPDAVLISLRTDQPINLVNAFEDPVDQPGTARSTAATRRLVDTFTSIENSYGDGSATNYVVVSNSTSTSLSELSEPQSLCSAVDAVAAKVEDYLGAMK